MLKSSEFGGGGGLTPHRCRVIKAFLIKVFFSQALHTCCYQECSSLNLWIQLYEKTLFSKSGQPLGKSA